MTDTKQSDVFSMLEDRRSVLGPLHTQIAIDELLIGGAAVMGSRDLMQYLRGFPRDFTARIPSIAADAVQRLRNQIVVGETPDPKVMTSGSRRGEQKDQHEKEDRLELQRFLKAELEHLDAQSSLFLPAADHILGLGMAVVSYPFVKARLPKDPFAMPDRSRRQPRPNEEKKRLTYERQRRGAIPFDAKIVHPVTAFFDIYNQPIQDMIVEEEVRLGSLAQQYPHLGIGSGQYGQTAKLVSYCSAREYGYWLDNVPLLRGRGVNSDGIAENTTGVLWYGMAISGYGFAVSKGGWEHAIQGVVRGARSAILSLITDYNIQEIMKLLYVWPQREFEVKDEQGQLELDQYETGPNAMWAHGQSVRRIPTDATQIPQWAFEVENLNSGMLEAHVGAKVLSGVDEDDTASGLRTRVGLARAPTRITKRSLERMFSNMTMDMVWIQKHQLGQPLCIPTANGYEDFDAAKIPDETRVDIDLTPATQEDITFQLEDSLKRMQAGARSVRKVLEDDPSIDDVDEELINIDADAIMKQGDVLAAASAEANRRFQERIGAAPVEGPVPGALPGDPAQVSTLGSPQDLAMQEQIARNGAGMAPPPLLR